MTKTKKTPFRELTKEQQDARLAEYAAEQKARGTERMLFNVVAEPKIVKLKDDAMQVRLRLAHNPKEGDTVFMNMTKYIKPGQDKLMEFFRSLQKGQLLDVEYKKATIGNKTYNNIYSAFRLERKNNKKAASANA